MGLRFNPPPNWPPPPPGFVPPPRWQPDPAWPPPPPGWQLWVPDDGPAGPPDYPGGSAGPGGGAGPGGSAGPRDFAGRPRDFADGPSDFADRPPDFADRPPDFTTDPRGFAASSRDFRGGPAAFAAGTGAFAAGAGEFAAGRDEYPGGPGEFAARPGDFGDGRGDFGAGAATELDPFGPGAYPGPPGGRGPAPRRGTNGFAIAAFVLSLLGGTLLSLILAAIALGQIRRTPQRGRGLAIASIVLSVFWIAVLAFFLVASSAKTPSSPSATGGGTSSAPAPSPSISPSGGSTGGGGGSSTGTSVFALRTGQCFQNPPASQAILGITTVTVVPCTTRHNAQVFVEFAATGKSTYPGRSALKRQADTGCHARISGNVASSKITNSMTLRFLYPLQVSWAEGHRTITCLIVDAKPDLKSSLLRAHPKH